jgi:hypothetical protein
MNIVNEHDDKVTLSEAGRRRIDQMRNELLAELQRVHRRRRQRRSIAAVLLLTLIVGGWWMMQFPQPTAPILAPPQLVQSPAESPAKQPVPDAIEPIRTVIVPTSEPSRIERLETDAMILDRYRTHDLPLTHVTYLSDEELVRELAAIGEPASIVRLPDRVLLVRAPSSEPNTLR